MSTGAIVRAQAAAATASYDLIVVGGGVYGIMVALEATRRELRPLLLERADFAGATSANSLRILHGGLRYLQRLDFARARESSRERVWWRRHFPELVQPLPCLMPLYGDGLRRPAALRLALALNDWLVPRDGAGAALPGGRVLPPAAVRQAFPGVDARGLQGGALWYDAFAAHAPRLLIEALRWACAAGADALNYVEAVRLLEARGRVEGVLARDLESGASHEFRAGVVINATGPGSRSFAAAAGMDEPRLFAPTLAWNVAFACEPPSDRALAVCARRKGAQTYFLVPWKGALLAGTGHAPWRDAAAPARLPEALLARFIAELNEAVPGLGVERRVVRRVLAGFLPARRPGTTDLAGRPVVIDHGAQGGRAGFFSLCGVKLTTARAVAAQVLRRAFPARAARPEATFQRPPPACAPDYPLAWRPAPGDDAWRAALAAPIAEEAVCHLDDLLLRRSCLGDDPERALALAPAVCSLFEWDAQRSEAERLRLRQALGGSLTSRSPTAVSAVDRDHAC